ncbi:MAG: hypothetical protein IJJ33_10085 [Victivallales bacterium]|nr:hypothetical protein [Victivallales bacterium]
MLITQKEENTIGTLYMFLHQHPHAILSVEMGGEESFTAVMDTAYDTDNGLEMDEEGYEEFSAIVLERQDNGEFVELTYHHFPKVIQVEGKVIFKNGQWHI